jgi:chemotaxis protein MotB
MTEERIPKKTGVDTWVAIVAMLLLGGLGWYTFKLHFAHADLEEDEKADKAALAEQQKKATALDTQLSSCVKDRADEKANGEAATKSAADANASLSATQAELTQLKAERAEAEARLAAFKAVTEKLKKMIDSGKLKVEIRNGRMIVKVPASILFASGSAELSGDGKSAISDIASILKQFPDRRFEVAGHTDNIPVASSTFKDNWALSTARAVTVTEQLVSAGMNPARLVAAGYGQFAPMRDNNSDAGRQENRRIEIVLLPNLSELPPLPSTSVASSASASPSPSPTASAAK